MFIESVRYETKGLGRLMAFTEPKTYNRAVRGTLRYVAGRVRTESGKQISARYGLKSARIKADIGAPRFNSVLGSASIPFSRKPPTIRAFSAKFNTSQGRSSARGKTSWKIFKGETVRSTNVFWRMSNGRMLPFISKRHGGSEQPYYNGIRVLYGPSVGSIFAGDSRYGKTIKNNVEGVMGQAFSVGLSRELRRITIAR